MHYLYILRSKSSGKYYIGETKDTAKRFKQHREGKTLFGKRNKEIELIYQQKFENREQAKKVEYFLKAQKSCRFIEKFIKGEIVIPR